jgi:hypothetical protein
MGRNWDVKRIGFSSMWVRQKETELKASKRRGWGQRLSE